MAAEKTEAIVIRLADFSESSKVVTLMSRDFGKISALAKGAKRLKSAFESGLDLLSRCHIVFLPKGPGALDLLTESQLLQRFQPRPGSLPHLYSGYYVAELLNALVEERDSHPNLFDIAVETLDQLQSEASPFVPITRFELALHAEIGQLPDLYSCTICHQEMTSGQPGRFWVSQSGLICSNCGVSEYQASECAPETLDLLRHFVEWDGNQLSGISVSPRQKAEIRRFMTSAISALLGRRPKTLSMIQM
ncbi:MAG TPA: DNA repair protein RecO [Planctomicrobium sp.]|nr:DNA repair protein RecO [Planctomicrobium sp.]